jgi:hypothetical protein
MRKFAIVFVIVLFASLGVAKAQEPVDEIDLEVVRLLSLNIAQAVAYSTIMQRRRIAFRSLKPRNWEQQMAFYKETFDMLKPVLTKEQHMRFMAYIDSFIEGEQDEEFLAKE